MRTALSYILITISTVPALMDGSLAGNRHARASGRRGQHCSPGTSLPERESRKVRLRARDALFSSLSAFGLESALLCGEGSEKPVDVGVYLPPHQQSRRSRFQRSAARARVGWLGWARTRLDRKPLRSLLVSAGRFSLGNVSPGWVTPSPSGSHPLTGRRLFLCPNETALGLRDPAGWLVPSGQLQVPSGHPSAKWIQDLGGKEPLVEPLSPQGPAPPVCKF